MIIDVKDWSTIEEEIKSEDIINFIIESAKEFLAKSDKEKETEVSKTGMSPEEIQHAINMKTIRSNAILKMNLNSFKTVYDMFERTSTNIEIDLTNNQ